jgi:translocation and assembly module TamB
VAALAVLAGFGSWWLFYTQPGAKWGFERLGGFFPGRLDVKDLHGPLRGPLEVRHFTYRNDHMAITADRVFIDWKLRELMMHRRLDIYKMRGENVRVVVGGPGDTPQAQDSLAGPLPDLNLPVTVIVHDALIEGLTIAKPGSDSGLVLDKVMLEARSQRGDSLRVNRLTVQSKPLDLEFSGVAMPRGSYPLTLRGGWTFRPKDSPPITGVGALTGSLDTLRVVQDLSGSVTAHVDMRLFRPLRRLRFDGGVEFSDFTPRHFSAAWPEGTYRGRVHVAGEPQSFLTEGAVAGTVRQLGPTHADFRARRSDQKWLIDNLVLTRPGNRGRLQAHGTIEGDSITSRFDLQTQWVALGWPLRGPRWVESNRGSARIQGTTRNFGIHLRASLAGRNLPPGQWTLDGRGGPGRLAIRTVIAEILDGRIVGAGTVAWDPRVRWRLTFDGKGINPGTVWPAYPGKLDFAGRSEGVQERSGPTGQILVSRLAGTIRNQPVTASGTVFARRGEYSLSQAVAMWGPNRVEASGGIGKVLSLDWKLDAPKIGASLAQASGSLRGQGTLRGSRRQPHITGFVTGESLFVGQFHANALRADGDLDLRPGGVLKLVAAATRVNAGTHAADRLEITANGTRENHQWRASVAGPRDSTVAVLAGGFGAGGWSGQVRALDLVNPRSGNWSLASPARLTASMRHAELSDFAWRSGNSRLTASANWTRGGPWRVESGLDSVQLALIQPQLPPRLRLEGVMRGHVVLHGTGDGRLFADVDVVPGPGNILYQNSAGQWVPTRFENARIQGTADGNRLQTAFGADLVGAGTVRGDLAWPAYGSFAAGTSRPLDGHLVLHLRDLALVQAFTPEVDAPSGSLDADMTIAGTVQTPFLYGPLSLKNGSANVPRYGLQLRDINIQGTGSPGGKIALAGSARSGTGVLNIDGTAAVAAGAKPVANVHVHGTRIQAMNTRDMQFVASPDIVFALDGRRLDITGEVIIPEGKIGIGRADDRKLIKISPDVIYAGSDTLTGAPMEVRSRIRLELGENVRVTGFGIDGRPTGSVLAIDAPGLPTLGSGRFNLQDGRYKIYGQELNIESGSLIFGGGPIMNPAVRARALRKAADGTVAGFLVSGTVMRPEVQVFSEPPMGQSEALSYVMFGKPIERGNLSEGQIASRMALLMGVPGTNLLAQSVASEVGIEQASININGSLQNTNITLGTHLSEKLYVSYGVDVFQSVSSLLMRYILNRMLTVEAETSHQNRVDLLYNVER